MPHTSWTQFNDIDTGAECSCAGRFWRSVNNFQSVHVILLVFCTVRRYVAVIAVGLLSFTIGLASALDVNIFVNQDAVWAHALILSGCFLIFLVARYGALKFRRVIYNEVQIIISKVLFIVLLLNGVSLQYGIGDWPLPYLWVFVAM